MKCHRRAPIELSGCDSLNMDIDSLLLVISLAGFVLIPFWAKWWNAAPLKFGAGRPWRIAGVLFFSLTTLLVTHAGPWAVLSAISGTLHANVVDPRRPIGMLILFGPGVAAQIACALYFAMRRDEMPN